MKREIAADGRVTFVEYVRSIGRKSVFRQRPNVLSNRLFPGNYSYRC